MADLEAVAADAVAVGEAMALAVAGAGAVVLYVGQTRMGGWDGVSEESGGLRVAIRPSGVRRLRAVSCGQGHCVVLGHGGEVFAWGSNDHGQTGVGSESDEEPSPREVLGLSGKGVGQLACGAVHTVALCEGGAVLGAGSNRQGQLGLRGVGELRRAGGARMAPPRGGQRRWGGRRSCRGGGGAADSLWRLPHAGPHRGRRTVGVRRQLAWAARARYARGLSRAGARAPPAQRGTGRTGVCGAPTFWDPFGARGGAFPTRALRRACLHHSREASLGVRARTWHEIC